MVMNMHLIMRRSTIGSGKGNYHQFEHPVYPPVEPTPMVDADMFR
jgi:hypothetical protein